MQPLKEYSLRSEDWPLALLMKGPAVLSKLRQGDPPADKPVAAILSEQEAEEAAADWEQHELGKNGASLACVIGARHSSLVAWPPKSSLQVSLNGSV